MSGKEIQDVNIELGDDASRMLYEASKLTWNNRPGLIGSTFDSFSGFRALDGDYLGDLTGHWLQIGLDGTGTKVEIAERTRNHRTIAHDLFAMVCDDAAVRGAEPLAVGSILDVNNLDDTEETKQAMHDLAQGYVEAANKAGVVIANGELAELGGRIDGYTDDLQIGGLNYNWGAVVIWDALKSRALDGTKIKTGDTLVGFAERGFRSNGITDVRKGLRLEYGPEWHELYLDAFDGQNLGKLALTPSTIYCKIITELTGGRDAKKDPKAHVSGVAHITGGGLPSKLGRMLEASGHGAILRQSEAITPPQLMKHVQDIRNFDDKTAYGKWHMGPGMIVVTTDPETVIETAATHGVIAAQIGKVAARPTISIKSQGARTPGSWLHF